jgi:hypothetical protein
MGRCLSSAALKGKCGGSPARLSGVRVYTSLSPALKHSTFPMPITNREGRGYGKDRKGKQRFVCRECKISFSEASPPPH